MNTINNHGIDVSVTVNGRPTRTYLHEGKYFIESRDGTEYAIEIKNNNWYRVEAVVAVDGLSVINGKAASKDDSGYIIQGHDKLVVKGFRKDLNEVGAFKFTKKEKSYAAGKGQADNVGVIAIAIYPEKHATYSGILVNKHLLNVGTTIINDNWITSTATNLDSTGNAEALGSQGESGLIGSGILRNMNADVQSHQFKSNTLRACAQDVLFEHGTQWGKKIADRVVNVYFERGCQLLSVEVFYNSKENLEEMGIKFIQEKQITFPKGFPLDFCTPPPGWTGQ